MAEGAVYTPALETVPTLGLTDHVTTRLAAPVTAAVNCCVWLAVKVTVTGLTVTWTAGSRLIAAVADFDGSATLVAVKVIV